MNLRLCLGVAATCWLAFGSGPARAATCSVSAQAVSFGSYDSLSPVPLDGVGNIHVTCDAPVNFTVTLAPGSGSYNLREMTAGADKLGYNLFTDAARTFVWGDGITGDSVSVTGDNVDLPVYGRIPSLQNVPALTYSDAMTVTVSY